MCQVVVRKDTDCTFELFQSQMAVRILTFIQLFYYYGQLS